MASQCGAIGVRYRSTSSADHTTSLFSNGQMKGGPCRRGVNVLPMDEPSRLEVQSSETADVQIRLRARQGRQADISLQVLVRPLCIPQMSNRLQLFWTLTSMHYLKFTLFVVGLVALGIVAGAPAPNSWVRCDLKRVMTQVDQVPMIMQAATGVCANGDVCCLHPDGPVFKSLVRTGFAHG